MKWIAFAAAIAAAAPVTAQTAATPQLLILGAPHFGNPGRDIANTHLEDVRAPARQREIEAVVARLASFHPTRVAIEWPADRQDRLDRRYADYRAGRIALDPDESDQIGLRLAARLGLDHVDAIDWNQEPPGRDEDYDFPAWAAAHGRAGEWQAHQRAIQARADAEGRLMTCTPISAWFTCDLTSGSSRSRARSW